jgi:hypothetical protein
VAAATTSGINAPAAMFSTNDRMLLPASAGSLR